MHPHRFPSGLSCHVVLLEKIEVVGTKLDRLESEPGLVVPVLLGLEGNPVGLPVGKAQKKESCAVEPDLENVALAGIDLPKPSVGSGRGAGSTSLCAPPCTRGRSCR